MDRGTQPRPNPTNDLFVERLDSRLDSWKEIATYLGRSEKTARRWETRERLPVHRLLHEKAGSVYAYTGELDAWRSERKATAAEQASGSDAGSNDEGQRIIIAGSESADERPRPRLQRRPWLIPLAIITAISVVGFFAAIRWNGFGRGIRQVSIQSLAVLPLENLSEETGWEYFADGMTAELITELAKIPSLRVISRTSAMRYKRTRKSLKEIAHELNVDAIVEGEVLNSKQRVRVTAQLIQTATDRHLWAETYDRDLRDAVDLQAELAESISNAIKNRVTPAGRPRAPAHRADVEAYQAYLKGRFYWNKRTESGLKKSGEYFQLAIDKDPTYALAYAALADSYQLLGVHEWSPMKGTYSKAKLAANKALELDNSLGEAHTVLAGVTYGLDRNWQSAEREFKRALELSPGYATAHARYALFLARMGRTEESLAEMRRAQSLDPLSPGGFSGIGWLLLSARRYDEAIKQLQNALEMDTNLPLAHMHLGRAYEGKGKIQKALEELRKASALNAGPAVLASLAYAYARGGYILQAQGILRDLQERSEHAYVPPYDFAIVYAGFGEKDRALEWLSRSCKDQDVELVALNTDLELDDLRSDPRFRDLLRCVGLHQ